jgi:hypothetical protein
LRWSRQSDSKSKPNPEGVALNFVPQPPPEGGPSVSDHMVIFTRTFDFLTWLLPVSNRFPTA